MNRIEIDWYNAGKDRSTWIGTRTRRLRAEWIGYQHRHRLSTETMICTVTLYLFLTLSAMCIAVNFWEQKGVDLENKRLILNLDERDQRRSLKEMDSILLHKDDDIEFVISDDGDQQNVENQDGSEFHDDDHDEEDGMESLDKSPEEIRIEIISEFKWAWKSYKECAWGFDTVHPIACKGTNDAFDMGLAMIDSLDTMIIMDSVVCYLSFSVSLT